MPRGIYVPLPDEEREALFDLADREWRRPVDQAIKLISDGLRGAGALPLSATKYREVSTDRATDSLGPEVA